MAVTGANPNPTNQPTTPAPATPPADPEPTTAEASLRRTLQIVVIGLLGLAALFTLNVLTEHPSVVPALQGLGSIVAVIIGIAGAAKLINRQRP
ncbi:hypothetical protein ACFYOD_39135 [Streptomyces sp. NPDC006703]|uniref:hypothetical protein n=1 Tax=Streptomyces sp. NPDC006703 TaxID=3364759 RepID=UPI0036ACBF20